jgi:DNA-binding beta-propeller fold protein YncE
VDPRTLRVLDTTTVGTDPTFLAAAGGLIWVVNQGDGTVTRIDARTGNTVGLPIRITGAGNLAAAGRLGLGDQPAAVERHPHRHQPSPLRRHGRKPPQASRDNS